MIDCETKVFNNVYEIAAPLCAPKRFLSRQIADYTKLPAAGLWEMDNTTVRSLQSSTPTENFAEITWQLDVVATTKAECRRIFAAIDERMIQLNFNRMSGQFIEYPDNTKIVRYVARYEAVVDPDGNLYRPG